MGEGVRGYLQGPKSSGHLVLKAYVRYLSTVVQRLFRTIRYYIVDFMNKAAYVHQSGIHLLYYSQSTIVLFAKHTFGEGPLYVRTIDNSVSLASQQTSSTKRRERTSANPSIHLH
jgi:hypothetical protein